MKRLLAVAVGLAAIFAVGVGQASPPEYEGYHVVNVVVNGKPISGDVPGINFNGHTMVPLRAIADAVGAQLQWNSETSTAELTTTTGRDAAASNASTDQESADLAKAEADLKAAQDQVLSLQAQLAAATQKLKGPTPTPSDVGRSRMNPVPTGTALVGPLVQNQVNFTARFTVTQVVRGNDAWAMIHSANMFNPEPPAGFEYMLVKMRYEVSAIDDLNAAAVFDSRFFTAVSASGADYTQVALVAPDPQFGGTLYKGASAEGWMPFRVAVGDSAPLLVIARDSQGRSGYWFAVQPTATGTTTQTQQPVATQSQGASGSTPLSSVTPATLVDYLNTNYGTVQTVAGTLHLSYAMLSNDKSFLPYDYWIQMVISPGSFFDDLKYKVTLSDADRQAALDTLRAHAKVIYQTAATVLGKKKIQGKYYYGWYDYPDIQVGYHGDMYLSWQNYAQDPTEFFDLYKAATVTDFHFDNSVDTLKF